jgi:hypothetical protein
MRKFFAYVEEMLGSIGGIDEARPLMVGRRSSRTLSKGRAPVA